MDTVLDIIADCLLSRYRECACKRRTCVLNSLYDVTCTIIVFESCSRCWITRGRSIAFDPVPSIEWWIRNLRRIELFGKNVTKGGLRGDSSELNHSS